MPEFRAIVVTVTVPLDLRRRSPFATWLCRDRKVIPKRDMRIYSPPASTRATTVRRMDSRWGYIFGTIDMSDPRCVQTAETLDCVVCRSIIDSLPSIRSPRRSKTATPLGVDRRACRRVGYRSCAHRHRGQSAVVASQLRSHAGSRSRRDPLCYQMLIYPMIATAIRPRRVSS